MQFIRNSAIYLGSSLLNKAIPFLLLPVLTEYLSPAEYGIVTLFQILITFSNAIFGMNIHTNVARNFFQRSKEEMAVLIGNIMWILSIATLLGLLITFGLTLYFDELFSVPANWLRAIPLLSFMFMVNTINLTLLRMEERALAFGVFEVSNTAINMGVTILFLVHYGWGWESRAIGITLAYGIFFLVGMIYMGYKGYISAKADRTYQRNILNVSLPLIPHALGSIVITMSDRLFIERMLNLEVLGIYSVGYMFGMVVMLFTDAFAKAWGPWFYKKILDSNEQTKRNIVKYTYWYIAAVILLALLVWLASSFILPWVVADEYLGASQYILWIALGYVFFGIYQIFFPYLVHMGRTAFLAKSTMIAALVNIGLNYLLILELGAIGAAYATIISYALSAVLVFWYQNKHYPMPWSLK